MRLRSQFIWTIGLGLLVVGWISQTASVPPTSPARATTSALSTSPLDGNGITSTVAAASPTSSTVLTTTIVSTSTTIPLATFESAWNPSVAGLLTFRGDANRRYYGSGPVPNAPTIAWQYPKNRTMCRTSTAKGETKQWCGAGWTGQPTVHERDGKTWLIFNAYDGAVHFVDALTGEEILAPFQTGDIIKGSVTVDPDGFPLVYSGSRDNYFRVLAIDRMGGKATELWRLSADAVSPTLWNNDWDGSALIVDDYLIEGGENSQLHVVKLNRGYDAQGQVTVDPQLVFNTPGWDDELRRDLAGRSSSEVSIESSVALDGDVVYFTNSGGLVQGWDLGPLRTGGTPMRVFRFWAGDDSDATVVVDEEGFLYVGVEYERNLPRSREVGQVIKLDPTRADDPVVWSFFDTGRLGGGVWSTVAITNGVVVTTTDGGRVVGLDQDTGEALWEFTLPGPLWQSPVIVDDTLIQGDCAGVLHGYDVSDIRTQPQERWSVELGGCIEATPAVWNGSIYLATRGGRMFALRDVPEKG
jgi:outer membrane protein assembly factor BamB